MANDVPHLNCVTSARHLLVDGTNILHAWPDFRILLKRDRDTARSRLVQRLTAIHDVENVRVTIVFDGRGPDIVVESPIGVATLSVVYTSSGLTADDVIEQMVGNASEPTKCVVATDDAAERQTTAAAGAEVTRSTDLAAWLARAEARQTAMMASRREAIRCQWKKP